MARTSFAASDSGKRTVNLTSARAWGVGLGPLGAGEEGAPGVVEKGHLSNVMAHAWLSNARIVINKKMQREKKGHDFIALLNLLVSTVLLLMETLQHTCFDKPDGMIMIDL